ncbi:MAG: hypothetical protein IPH45_19340 [Bacteroidales bacterium]|nr:hypothetical protein [Bacteroidales bacterium]
MFEKAIPYTSDKKGQKLLAGIYQELGNIKRIWVIMNQPLPGTTWL